MAVLLLVFSKISAKEVKEMVPNFTFWKGFLLQSKRLCGFWESKRKWLIYNK
jgi:hypothetical protein